MRRLQDYEKNNKNYKGDEIIPGICLHENLYCSKLTKNVFNCFTITLQQIDSTTLFCIMMLLCTQKIMLRIKLYSDLNCYVLR